MTTGGIVVGTAIGIALLLWVVMLIRQDRLYAGYGVIFIVGTIAAIIVLAVPPVTPRGNRRQRRVDAGSILEFGRDRAADFSRRLRLHSNFSVIKPCDAPDAGTRHSTC
jgi:hypothetical protein